MLFETSDRVPRLAEFLVKSQYFSDVPVCVVDVGAAGGIHELWKIFGDQLEVIGFEPLRTECDRLNATRESNRFRFYSYAIGASCKADEIPAEYYGYPGSVYWRSSAKSYNDQERKRQGLAEAPVNCRVMPDAPSISLDDFFRQEGIKNVDFIKTDTDGSDLQVLKGAHASFSRMSILGILAEANYNVDYHPNIGLFSNVDIYLRQHGFSLFDLGTARYSRAALPTKFSSPRGTMTQAGQLHFGDFLYLRDEAYLIDKLQTHEGLKPEKLIKLAALYDVFAFPDCAVELLLKFREELAHLVDVDRCLDLCVPPLNGQQLSFGDYIEMVTKNPAVLLPDKF